MGEQEATHVRLRTVPSIVELVLPIQESSPRDAPGGWLGRSSTGYGTTSRERVADAGEEPVTTRPRDGVSAGVRHGRMGCLSPTLGKEGKDTWEPRWRRKHHHHARTTPEDQERPSDPLSGANHSNTFVGPKAGTLWGGTSPTPASQGRNATCLPAKTQSEPRQGMEGST